MHSVWSLIISGENSDEKAGKEKPLFTVGQNVDQYIEKSLRRFLRTPERELLCDPARLLLGVSPKDSVPHCRDTCTATFIAALVTIARKWNEPDVYQLKEVS